MNDPLLPIDPLLNKTATTMYPPPAPQPTIAPTVQKKASVPMRKKHPALSARILAVGLSTTALIGMTSGYTMAQKQPATQPVVQDPAAPVSAATPANQAPQPATAAKSTTPQATVAVAPNATQVIQVPVPVTASAATPGTAAPAYQPAQTPQKSSGSN